MTTAVPTSAVVTGEFDRRRRRAGRPRGTTRGHSACMHHRISMATAIARTIAIGSTPACAGAIMAMTGMVAMHSSSKVAGSLARPCAMVAKARKTIRAIGPEQHFGRSRATPTAAGRRSPPPRPSPRPGPRRPSTAAKRAGWSPAPRTAPAAGRSETSPSHSARTNATVIPTAKRSTACKPRGRDRIARRGARSKWPCVIAGSSASRPGGSRAARSG